MRKIKLIFITAVLLLLLPCFWYFKSKSKSIACETDFESERYILGLGYLHIKTTSIVILSNNGTGTARIRGFVTKDNNEKFKIDRLQEFSYTDETHIGHYNVVITNDIKKIGDNVTDEIFSLYFNLTHNGGDIKEITRLNGNVLLINSITRPDVTCVILK